jgi:hypothetical protein
MKTPIEYKPEKVPLRDGGVITVYIICDSDRNRIGIIYDEKEAQQIVRAVNGEQQKYPDEVDAVLDELLEFEGTGEKSIYDLIHEIRNRREAGE